jgi:hypothetical protein
MAKSAATGFITRCRDARSVITLMLINGGADFVVKDHHRDAWHWKDHKDYCRAMAGLPE